MKEIIGKIQIIAFLVLLVMLPVSTKAYFGRAKETHPRIGNYYLKWEIPNNDVEKLAFWDVLILDMETQYNSRNNLKRLRELNPNIIILAYITSQEIKTNVGYLSNARLRNKLLAQINEGWWLRDGDGNKISFWPGTNMLNVTSGASFANGHRWNTLLPTFVKNEIISSGLWDGVFYDNIWPSVAWVNGSNIDINNNKSIFSTGDIDRKWREGNISLLQKTQELIGSRYLVVGNGQALEAYQPYLNGIMLESFPAPWEADGTWAGSMKSYFNDKHFKSPKIFIVNSNNNNNWAMNNYRKMRFSLGSVLLGDGYFSFDYGVNDHSQTWWYDEYEADLGRAKGSPYNILDRGNPNFKEGVWRRDFDKGIVIVNSTSENKNYVFRDEQFEKINGSQDMVINNGARVNMVSMMGKDAIVLLGEGKEEETPVIISPTVSGEEIKGVSFNNGGFVRVFNKDGNQVRSGFFTYVDRYPAGSQVLITDIDGDRSDEELVNYRGVISIYKNGRLIKSFRPYDNKFKGEISLAVSDLNGDATKEIITGAGRGGGPHVRVFDKDGNLLIGGFFAYDENFRGGVDVAVMDLNGDGTREIITAAGPGGGPHIRIFTKDGKPLTSGFFAYNQNFRGGVSITIGNVDGGGDSEIITGAGPGGGPEVKIFNKDGRLIRSFFSYDKDDRSGIKVMATDMDNDNIDEILANNLGY